MSYQAAVKEAFALAQPTAIIDTLEIWLEPVEEKIYLCCNTVDLVCTLETAEVVTFVATGAKIELPSKDNKGFQELLIAMANTNLVVSDFLQMALAFDTPVNCNYRPYLANNLTAPQMIPPLVLTISEAAITAERVDAKATFADILNKKFLSEKYTLTNFPAL